MQTFAVVDHIFLAGLGHHTPGLSQLSHFSERGLIGKVVSAGSHNPHAKRASFRRDCGCRDQLNLRIFKYLVKRTSNFNLWESFAEVFDLEWIRIENPA